MGMSVPIQELPDRTDHQPLLLVGQLRIHRQGQGLPRGRFRVREIAGLMTQRCKARLQMQGDRVVDLRPDLPARQVLAHRVADRAGTRMTY